MNAPFFAVFPGQGSQHVGMLKELYQEFALVRQVFEEASDAIQVDIKKLSFEGPETDLTLTENTQPCLLTASVATYRIAQKEFGIQPSAVAGHSLGEYSALAAIHCLPFATCVRWVKSRGQAMQKAVPYQAGGMAAILGLLDSQIESLCKKATSEAISKREIKKNSYSSSNIDPFMEVDAVVEPANFNSPGQVVVAGSADAILECKSILETNPDYKGGKFIPLQVSAPFHCQLMKPAAERMEELFSHAHESEKPKNLLCSYVPNRTGRLSQEHDLVFQLLVEQVYHPVLWKQSISTLLDSSLTHAVEFGPGKVLSGLIKRIANDQNKKCQILSVHDLSSFKKLETFFHTS